MINNGRNMDRDLDARLAQPVGNRGPVVQFMGGGGFGGPTSIGNIGKKSVARFDMVHSIFTSNKEISRALSIINMSPTGAQMLGKIFNSRFSMSFNILPGSEIRKIYESTRNGEDDVDMTQPINGLFISPSSKCSIGNATFYFCSEVFDPVTKFTGLFYMNTSIFARKFEYQEPWMVIAHEFAHFYDWLMATERNIILKSLGFQTFIPPLTEESAFGMVNIILNELGYDYQLEVP